MSVSLFFKTIRNFHNPLNPCRMNKYNIGFCKSVEIVCISELGWKDNKTLVENVQKFGNLNTSQYKIEWKKENSAGASSLIILENLKGEKKNFLVDVGWDKDYIDESFKREKVDELLGKKEIEFVFITHEHMDHFFGIECVLKVNNKIPLVIPHSFSAEGYKILKGEYPSINKIKHEGPIYKTFGQRPYLLYDGCAAYCFNVKTLLGIEGEQTLYFNVKDKGIVGATGCCHGGIIDFLEVGQTLFNSNKIHGIYGGLHIAPFENLDKDQEDTIKKLKVYGLEKIACNHCTGHSAVDKMIQFGYPIVRGSGKYGSQTDKFLGNGDRIKF